MVHRALSLAESMSFALWSHRVKCGASELWRREGRKETVRQWHGAKDTVVCLFCFPSALTQNRNSIPVCHFPPSLKSCKCGSKWDRRPQRAGCSAWLWSPCPQSMQVPFSPVPAGDSFASTAVSISSSAPLPAAPSGLFQTLQTSPFLLLNSLSFDPLSPMMSSLISLGLLILWYHQLSCFFLPVLLF